MPNFRSPRWVLSAVAIGAAVATLPHASAAVPVIPPNGPHGCALTDVAGRSTPVLHDSDTSHIGGRSCVYLQVASDPALPQGGSYDAAARSWSIVSKKRVCRPAGRGHRQDCSWVADPRATFSSATGSPSVGQYVIPVGDKIAVTVTNGTISSGTLDGAPGS